MWKDPPLLKLMVTPILCICALLASADMSISQEPAADCSNPQTQFELNFCAGQDFKDADVKLNAEYKIQRDEMRRRDADASEPTKGAEQALIEAQRAWVTYRDAHCISYGFQFRGGSMEPMQVAACKADLTRERTKELEELAVGG